MINSLKIFQKFTNHFIDEITDYKYPLNTHNYDFRKSTFKSQLDRYSQNYLFFFRKRCLYGYQIMKVLCDLQKLLRQLSAVYKKEGFNPKYVGLHNMVNHFTLEEIYDSSKYFDDFKMIIIDRDPRDVFIDFPHHRYLPRNVTI